MDQRPNDLDNSSKPSKVMTVIALMVAFALPFILVKSFPHKHSLHSKAPAKVKKRAALPSFIPPITFLIPNLVPNLPLVPKTLVKNNSPPKVEKLSQKATKALTLGLLANNLSKKKPPRDDWKVVTTKPGDNLGIIFRRLGLSPQTLHSILSSSSHVLVPGNLKPNQQLRFLIKDKQLEKLTMPLSTIQDLEVYRVGKGYKSIIHSRKMDSRNAIISATLQGSLQNTAKKYNIPTKLIQQMTEIFTWDINFVKDVRSGDQFTIIYKAFYVENKLVAVGDIVAVNYQNKGRLFQAIQHKDRSGNTNYYTPDGRSLKKAFNRYPLNFSHISSSFSLARQHPILHYKRPHKGVDLAAPIGTPIKATGDGRVEIIGRQSGYGNMIKIDHNKTYSTVYGHMLKFQKGLSRGDFVKRGQIIGYVGQTGLASGPHCHYEFHINKQPKNPSSVSLPRGFPIPSREIASFKVNTKQLLAQLKTPSLTQIAKR